MQNKKGGAKVGEGSSGCVVFPHIKCNSSKKLTKKNNYVSKIINLLNNDKLDIIEELRINELLTKKDPENIYCATIQEMCKLTPEMIKNRSDVVLKRKVSKKKSMKEHCQMVKETNNYNIVMTYAGSDLFDVLFDKNLSLQYNFLIKHKIKTIIRHYLKGFQLLHTNYIIHQDVKPENLSMYIDVSKQMVYPKIIDFGGCEDLKKINTKSYDQIMNYILGTEGYMAPEKYLLSEIKKRINNQQTHKLQSPKHRLMICQKVHKILVHNEEDYLNRSLGITRQLMNLTTVRRKKSSFSLRRRKSSTNILKIRKSTRIFQLSDVLDLYDKIIKDISKETFLNNYYKPVEGIVYKADIYSLGVTFYIINKFTNIENPELYNLIQKMICFDPYKRYNVKQCLDHKFLKS